MLRRMLRRREEISQVYNTPLLELIFRAATVHRMYNDPQMVRLCCLLSVCRMQQRQCVRLCVCMRRSSGARC